MEKIYRKRKNKINSKCFWKIIDKSEEKTKDKALLGDIENVNKTFGLYAPGWCLHK